MGEGDRSCDEARGTQNHQNGSRALRNRASGTAARVEPVQLEQQAAHATSTPSGPERQAVHELSSEHARIMPASTRPRRRIKQHSDAYVCVCPLMGVDDVCPQREDGRQVLAAHHCPSRTGEPAAETPPPAVGGGACLLYTSDAADDLLCVDLGGRRI